MKLIVSWKLKKQFFFYMYIVVTIICPEFFLKHIQNRISNPPSFCVCAETMLIRLNKTKRTVNKINGVNGAVEYFHEKVEDEEDLALISFKQLFKINSAIR